MNNAVPWVITLLGVSSLAECLFQAVWNHQSDLPPASGVKDYDVFYFDTDLSWEAENEVILEARQLFEDLGVAGQVATTLLWFCALI